MMLNTLLGQRSKQFRETRLRSHRQSLFLSSLCCNSTVPGTIGSLASLLYLATNTVVVNTTVTTTLFVNITETFTTTFRTRPFSCRRVSHFVIVSITVDFLLRAVEIGIACPVYLIMARVEKVVSIGIRRAVGLVVQEQGFFVASGPSHENR